MPANADDARRFLHPETIAKIARLDVRAQTARRGLHRRDFTRARSSASRSSSSSTGSTSPGTTSATSTGRSGRRPTSSTSSSTRPRPTCGRTWSSTPASRWSTAEGRTNKYEYASTAAACLAYIDHPAAGLGRLVQLRLGRPPGHPGRSVAAATRRDHQVRRPDPKPAQQTGIRKVMRQVAESSPTRGLVVVFSDLLTDREDAVQGAGDAPPPPARRRRVPHHGRRRT